MPNSRLIGRCGLYCGACTIYRAYQDGRQFQELLAAKYNCQPEQVRCEGCQVLTESCWGYNCPIVACLRTHGYNFCYECAQWAHRTCEKYARIANSYAGRGEDVYANLLTIQAGHTDEWLQEQEQRWRCTACGQPSAAWDDRCRWCGAIKPNEGKKQAP
ncbi:MAG: DUF3795 domain-containing protein [Chloroflexi bacterium]|nr:DUF3795 domain-containing protein [Chloroflexota bacterium]